MPATTSRNANPHARPVDRHDGEDRELSWRGIRCGFLMAHALLSEAWGPLARLQNRRTAVHKHQHRVRNRGPRHGCARRPRNPAAIKTCLIEIGRAVPLYGSGIGRASKGYPHLAETTSEYIIQMTRDCIITPQGAASHLTPNSCMGSPGNSSTAKTIARRQRSHAKGHSRDPRW